MSQIVEEDTHGKSISTLNRMKMETQHFTMRRLWQKQYLTEIHRTKNAYNRKQEGSNTTDVQYVISL